MRTLCLIFSLYTLTLALTPCADGFCGGDDQHVASEAHEDEKQDDLCSSFCICACCGYTAVTIHSPAPNLFAYSKPATSLNTFYTTPHITDFSIDFWQPPKLG